jgi:hypothetical protein
MSQTEFANLTGLSRETTSRSCKAARVLMHVAVAMRFAQLLSDVQALLDGKHDRLRRRLRVAVRRAQVPVTPPTRRRRSPRRPKLPPPTPVVVPPPAFPEAPRGWYYRHVGNSLVLVQHKPVPRGII